MSDKVKKIPVLNLSGDALFFEAGVVYEIPIYQRAFAWGTELTGDVNRVDEVRQLMDDICTFSEENGDSGSYHIGSLVVRKDAASGSYEVVDGQQRLTALYVIVKCLNWLIAKGTFGNGAKSYPLNVTLKYANRDNSQNTIARLDGIIDAWQSGSVFAQGDEAPENGVYIAVKDEKWFFVDGGIKQQLESSICDAMRRVFARLEAKDAAYRQRLLTGLERTVLYRIELPVGADLNQYFEIMNIRGRQLEPADIVKARLMGVLKSDAQREWFARVWNACADMSGYVQMHFHSGEERRVLFGDKWDEMPVREQIDSLVGKDHEVDVVAGEHATLLSAILDEKPVGIDYGAGGQPDEEEDDCRFKSVIYFPHFLLHVLRVFNKRCEQVELQTGPLKEKDLAGEFESALKAVTMKKSPADWAWQFVICLLRCRTLFDRYFIKRDYQEKNLDGVWSVCELKKTDEKSWKYSETDGRGDDNARCSDNARCRMIESCLRVTYTEHKTMHWITKLLDWLYGEYETGRRPTIGETADQCELLAKEALALDLKGLKQESYRMGTRTPHLLFNYLDYILWSKNRQVEFAFEYRNSVEHWYPQHPTTIPEWTGGTQDEAGRISKLDRDGFGNLCLIHDSENSRFSNLPPTSKAEYSKEMNQSGSLKYRQMVETVRSSAKNVGDQEWKNKSFDHGKQMLLLLAKEVPGFDLGLEQYQWHGLDAGQ